jgi:hypothetical protein
MKVKTLACLCALAAIPAFGTDAVTSANTFGVLKVTCSAQKVIIATPWVKCGDATAAVKVTDLVMTSGLENGDAILVYQDGGFRSWVISGGAWVPQIVSQTGQTVSSGDAASAAIERGEAFWFVKNSFTAGNTYDLYLYGQDTTAGATSMIAPGSSGTPAYSLLASPNTTASDLNAKNFSGTRNAADEIRVPRHNLPDLIYTYKDGQGWGTSVKTKVGSVYKKVWTLGCSIPAGTGFWYVSYGGTGTITW